MPLIKQVIIASLLITNTLAGSIDRNAFLETLTPTEKAWLDERTHLTVSFAPDWPPFSFSDGNDPFVGIDRDFISELEALLDKQIVPVKVATWVEAYDLGVHNQVDFITGMAVTPERKAHFIFSDPYLSFPVAIITREDRPFLLSISSLDGLRFALPGSYITTEYFIRDHPNHIAVITRDSIQAMRMVSTGKADATLANLVAASTIIRQEGLTNLRVSGISDYHFNLCFGVPKERKILASILNKALVQIQPEKENRILANWIHLDFSNLILWSKVRPVLIALFFLILSILTVILIWNRKLLMEVTMRKRLENQLLASAQKKEDFLARVAHDLSGPLSTAKLYLETKQTEHDPDEAEFLHGSLDQMSYLVERLKNLREVEDDHVVVKKQLVSIKALFSKLVKLSAPAARKKQIDVIFDIRPNDLEILSDRHLLYEILENLLSNALKFSHPKTIIELRASQEGRYVKIEVADQGLGIPENEHRYIFKRFAKLSNQPTGGENSTGIGLTIVKELTEHLAGKIYFSSKTGVGSTFTIKLPLD
ncbi:MAG: transporter substrate-binding domain-containing protein [Verrucomicrobiota bacterium]